MSANESNNPHEESLSERGSVRGLRRFELPTVGPPPRSLTPKPVKRSFCGLGGGLERPQSTPSRPQVSRKFLCPTCSTRSRCHPVAAYAKVTPAAAGSKPFGHRVSLSAFENVNCIRFLGREILAAVPNRGSPPMRSFAGPRRSGPPCRGSPCQGFAFLGAAHESMRTPGFKMAFGSSSRLTERIDSANKSGRCAS